MKYSDLPVFSLFECCCYPHLMSFHKLGNRLDSQIFKGTRNALLWLYGGTAASSLNKTGQAFYVEYCIKVSLTQIPLFSFDSIATFLVQEIAVEFLVFCQTATSGADSEVLHNFIDWTLQTGCKIELVCVRRRVKMPHSRNKCLYWTQHFEWQLTRNS